MELQKTILSTVGDFHFKENSRVGKEAIECPTLSELQSRDDIFDFGCPRLGDVVSSKATTSECCNPFEESFDGKLTGDFVLEDSLYDACILAKSVLSYGDTFPFPIKSDMDVLYGYIF